MFKKVILFILLIAIVVGGAIAYTFYQRVYAINSNIIESKSLYIKTGTGYDALLTQLIAEDIIVKKNTFDWVAKKMNLPNKVNAGHYIIEPNLDNRALVSHLRSGKQEPVKLVFNVERSIADLAGTVAPQIEADSLSILNYIMDSTFLQANQLDSNSIMTAFIPNTYEFYWNTNAKQFTNKMLKASNQFWNKDRKAKAEKLGLNTKEVIAIASIVQQESNKQDEMPDIAGVYLNRVEKGWKLQADPTVKFAMGDFSIRRILNKHLKYDNPYNTYMYEGIPPGPICMPEPTTIDAVLNANEHDYMYFCAKDDFSGYHALAKTLKQHNINARNYQKALNRKKIFK